MTEQSERALIDLIDEKFQEAKQVDDNLYNHEVKQIEEIRLARLKESCEGTPIYIVAQRVSDNYIK